MKNMKEAETWLGTSTGTNSGTAPETRTGTGTRTKLETGSGTQKTNRQEQGQE